MTAAIADALNVPIPSDMSRPLYPIDVMSGPTYLSNPRSLPQAMGSVSPLSSPMSPVPGVVNSKPEMVQILSLNKVVLQLQSAALPAHLYLAIQFKTRQLFQHSLNQGINDGLIIDLQNIPNPSPKLAVANATPTSVMATGTTSSSAMATSTPNANAMDMTNDTALQHLPHLLADAPELTPLGLHGGLDIWLFRNTQKVLEWVGSARDATDPSFIQRQVILTLAYLDGVQYFTHDVPRGTPCLCQLPNSSVAILEFDQDINNMQVWLAQVHKDAKQLMNTPLGQYNSPASRSIPDDMEANALYAFIGRPDPSTGQVLGGMIQVHYTIQNLATFDVSAYSSQ